jgi:hypothetical protein
MFLEKKGIEVYQKSFGAAEFYEKMGKKNHSRLFLLSFNSKLSHRL